MLFVIIVLLLSQKIKRSLLFSKEVFSFHIYNQRKLILFTSVSAEANMKRNNRTATESNFKTEFSFLKVNCRPHIAPMFLFAAVLSVCLVR